MATTDAVEVFEFASGSITGREHQLIGKNNQDAFSITSSAGHFVAVVCDGCGSSKHSEVGAQIGASIIGKVVSKALIYSAPTNVMNASAFWEDIRREITHRLTSVAYNMTPSNRDLRETVERFFLFTIVGIAITPNFVVPFSIGDGIWIINGKKHRLGPFENNAPPYIGYGLIRNNGGWKDEQLRIRLGDIYVVEEVRNALIGTDGVIDLIGVLPEGEYINQFWDDSKYFTNQDGVRRRLCRLNMARETINWEQRRVDRQHGLLPDDTTLISIRRKVSL